MSNKTYIIVVDYKIAVIDMRQLKQEFFRFGAQPKRKNCE
jgi:hypothetical protein